MRMRRKFQRSLPFADAIFDRWERAELLGFGKGSSIYDSSLVFGEISVGENVWIGPFTILDGTGGGLSIGPCCSISAGVHLYTHDSVAHALSGRKAPLHHAPVAIGRCTFIGPHSIVKAGVTIGDHCVVAAHSFVNRDIPPRTIVAGTPARPVGRVEIDGEQVSLKYDREEG
ncbi:acyltransferase [Pseudodesulfovibrio sp. F-1]|uniref:Acyltransferase n=2 Tax=Pseudodesulfovibrio alkaliphilus TaxID=2661613 RepID=A0A7K1KN83_9BACT|nr:acyltransferase [Pseudodesulfovibrio alkaliphilus]